MAAADKRQQFFLETFRGSNFVLVTALEACQIPDETFRNWYANDPFFKKQFEQVADEQIVLMRQSLREMATGQHASAAGLPDKQLLKYFVQEFDKRHGTAPDEGLISDLKDLSEDDLEKIAKENE